MDVVVVTFMVISNKQNKYIFAKLNYMQIFYTCLALVTLALKAYLTFLRHLVKKSALYNMDSTQSCSHYQSMKHLHCNTLLCFKNEATCQAFEGAETSQLLLPKSMVMHNK